MVTLKTAESALKDVYLGVVANQLNVNANPLLAKIKRSNKDVWGKEIRKLAPFGINGGVGAGSETGALPTASGNGYVQFVSELKNLYGKIEISDKAVRASSSNAGAFVNLLSDEMEGLVKASAFNLGRMIYGDGTGLIATVSSVDGKTVSCDKVNNLIEGMLIDVYTAENKTSASPIKVEYVDRVNKTFIFSGNATVTAGDKLYVQGSKDFEISGLGRIFDESQSEIYGVSKSAYPWLKPYVSATATEVSDILIQEAIDFLDMNTDSQINFISCSSKVRRAYQEYLGAYRRNVDIAELEGGYKTITHNGIPVVADRFVDDDAMYLLNTNDFTLHELCDWKWLEGEDGRILKQNQGYPTYSATLVKYAELICDKPCGQAKISGIKSTVTNPFAN
ncbi:MAG: phage major capsid protein [Clostridiales bacterium]|nr:phage major capsid protein [Clostridiales bacterium]